MPSSTSNSKSTPYSTEPPQPTHPWGRIWVAALLLFFGIILSLEFGLRSAGHTPSIVDDRALWSYHREQVYPVEKTPIVLLGASRIQLGFDMTTFRKRFPEYEVVQLAVDGAHPMSTLKDLANDANFRGIVICDVSEPAFITPSIDSDLQQQYVDFYHGEWNLDKKLNRLMSLWLQEHFVVSNPNVQLPPLVTSWLLRRSFPRPSYLLTHPDRSRVADYTMLDIQEHRSWRLRKHELSQAANLPTTPEEWLADAMLIEPYVEAIEKRGGRVVFLRMPVGAELWELDEAYMPRNQYWDKFATRTAALTIHFLDYPSLTQFNLPDDSHLDYRDAPAFTSALLNELVQRHVLNESVQLTTGTTSRKP